MKSSSIYPKILILFVCFSFALSALNAGSVINDTLIIPYISLDPVIDGELDAEWEFPEIGMYVYTDGNTPEGEGGAADFSAHFRIAWNENGVFFFGKVFDDTIYVNLNGNSWEQDCFELYFDGGNEDASEYDDNDVQWRWVYGLPVDSLGKPGWADAGKWAWMETDSGYNFELRISADSLVKNDAQLFSLESGTVIGFEAQVTDNDTNAPDFITKWCSASNESGQDPSLFGTAVLGDDDLALKIKEIKVSPVIDGENTAGEWDRIPKIAMTVNADDDLPDGGFMEFSSRYRAAWNADGFYFFGQVIDDSIYTAGNLPWEQDCFELYFDGGNEDASEYDDNDVQWRWVYGLPVDSLGKSGWADAGTWAWMDTDSGWNFELRISADSLVKNDVQLFSLEKGIEIGWECQASDNDTGTRDCISKWWSTSHYCWLDPALLGTAVLVDTSGAVGAEITETNAVIALSVPSIPINSTANISYTIPARNLVKIVLYNLAGQAAVTLVNGVQSAGTYSEALDLSGLASGVYLCRLEAGNSTITKKITLIK